MTLRAAGPKEISEFLTYLAVEESVAASTQNLALSALLFLYREVLKVVVSSPILRLTHILQTEARL